MSNIYIQEPPTSGKVLLKTTVGDIDVELWSKECPKACRNFVQLCMEGYYDGTIFHRVVKDFIVQGGDPNGDGTGGDSIYGAPFRDEFHSRLRYIRRGLVGMANSDKDDNGSQFFFTMGPTPELQNKNTLFGKVTGDTVFNMLKLEEGLVDHNERPMYPQKIIRTEILSNPFKDIEPRVLKVKEDKKEKKKKKEKGVKNFGLLSFGEEAEEDEAETNVYVQKNAGKAKSMHDVVDDPKLSKAVVKLESNKNGSSDDDEEALQDDDAVLVKEESDDTEDRRQRIRDKLKNRLKDAKKETTKIKQELVVSDEDVLMTHEEETRIARQKQKEKIRQEILDLKKEYQTDKKIKEERLEKKDEKPAAKNMGQTAESNEYVRDFLDEQQKYAELKTKFPKKGLDREQFTLSMLSKFRSKLNAMKEKKPEDLAESMDDKIVEKEIQGDDWLAHTFKFQEDTVPVLAKDASTKGDDWYDVYDPRNPLNKRKRGESDRSKSNKRSK